MPKTELDLNNPLHQIIVGTLVSLVENQKYTAREVFELMEDVKNQTFFSLLEIQKEEDKK